MSSFFSALDPFGGFSKITDKARRCAATGSAIVALLSVVMSHTQATTRLQTVCDALFEHAIFGVEPTNSVLHEMYQKYFFQKNRAVFAPWKVLKAMDLSAVSGFNYNGVETLRKVECTEKYQRGILPARSSVQKAAYELHSVAQRHIPFERKQSAYGEMYQYNFEMFLRYVLKVFNIDVLAQKETMECSITLDGAELCNGISHITAGIKITDRRAIDPMTGIPLSTVDDEAFGGIFSTRVEIIALLSRLYLEKTLKKRIKSSVIF